MDLAKRRFTQVCVGLAAALAGLAAQAPPEARVVYGPLFGVLVWLYDWFGWKLATPAIDVSGPWHGSTTYTSLQRGDNPGIVFPHEVDHDLVFKQSPFGLSVATSPAVASFLDWKSDAASIDETAHIVLAYTVRRDPSEQVFPVITRGYEDIEVVERGFLGRPMRMRGTFYHAAYPGVRLFSGVTDYRRGRRPRAAPAPVAAS